MKSSLHFTDLDGFNVDIWLVPHVGPLSLMLLLLWNKSKGDVSVNNLSIEEINSTVLKLNVCWAAVNQSFMSVFVWLNFSV